MTEVKEINLLEIIKAHKILICVGSGGVGKTTMSAALGVYAAKHGLNVLVMTIDPSQRLKVALGISELDSKVVKVPGQNYRGELSALLLNAEEIFREFVTGSPEDPHFSEALLKNRLYKQLSTTLSGSQEFTSLLQLAKMARSQNYDLIILDTPPAQHAVDFLEAPEKINALFNDSVVRWFVGDYEHMGFIRKVIFQSTRTVLDALEAVTGSRFMSELNDFFTSVKSVQNKISDSTLKVTEVLRSPLTGYVVITGFDEVKLREAEGLKDYLTQKGYHMSAVLINRAFTQWAQEESLLSDPQIMQLYKSWAQFHAKREEFYKIFSSHLSKNLPVRRIPDLNSDISGLQGLEVVADEIEFAFSNYNSNNNNHRM
jgi:anion-transporting  ArsA/GET3 family ATPase